MHTVIKTQVGNQDVQVDLVIPKTVNSQFDFIEVRVDGCLIDMSQGFLHGTVLREKGILCKQTCMGINEDLIFTVHDAKKILGEYNVHLSKLALDEKIPYKVLNSSDWLSQSQNQSIIADSIAIQAMYYYFKRSATVNSPDHPLCKPAHSLTVKEKSFMGEFLTFSPYLSNKAKQEQTNADGAVLLESVDVYESLKKAVVQINNFRNGSPSVMDAKHPTLSPLFKDDGPYIIDMDDEDIPY